MVPIISRVRCEDAAEAANNADVLRSQVVGLGKHCYSSTLAGGLGNKE